jgi:hypothetical protein
MNHPGEFDIRQSGRAPCPYCFSARDSEAAHLGDWLPISTAPFDRDVQLSVIERGMYMLSRFLAGRRIAGGWMPRGTDRSLSIPRTGVSGRMEKRAEIA